MFTGIVEELGTVYAVEYGASDAKLSIKAKKVLQGTKIGDSIAVNGVCLTVVQLRPDGFVADVMPETLRRSSLGELKFGSSVNLERAMAADGRFGGHIVSGHIDATGTISSMHREGNAVWVNISAPDNALELIVEKGSIAIDGISLTVAGVTSTEFSVSIIPHTGEETTLLKKRVGDIVNLETDIVGKYVKKLLNISQSRGSSDITLEFLAENGF
jgi:riboflavin synthase